MSTPVLPTTLDKQGPLPLYHQLKAIILERVDSGEWPPGVQVPSERELCAQYRVSRITVRQALADLVSVGCLVRDQGRGTFVAPPRLAQPLNYLTSFTQDIRARGKQPSARVLQFKVIPAPPLSARVLHLLTDERVILLKRLRLTDGQPMAVETVHLSDRLCHALLAEDLERNSLYELLSHKLGIAPSRAHQQMEAAPCPAAEARLLQVRRGSPVLHIFRTTYTADGLPFEQVESFYRGDKYVFNAELHVEAAQVRPGVEPNGPDRKSTN